MNGLNPDQTAHPDKGDLIAASCTSNPINSIMDRSWMEYPLPPADDRLTKPFPAGADERAC